MVKQKKKKEIKGYITPPNMMGQHSYWLQKTKDSYGRAISEKQANKLLKTKHYKLLK